jgi:endonuclease/exonuclease/phosphatase family metal-dependent hydrolase
VAEPAGHLVIKAQPDVQAAGRHSQTLTILSANLWHDWPRFREQRPRLERLAQLIADQRVDVALLQEVARTRDWRSDERLADWLGMAYVYSRANGHEAAIGFEEGLAVFSRFPLADAQLRPLGKATNPFVRRLALKVNVLTPAGPLAAFSVHLGLLPRQNTHQLAQLISWVPTVADGKPAIIGGDFNSVEHRPQIRQAQSHWLDLFRHLHPQAAGATHQLRGPWGLPLGQRRLDYLFLHAAKPSWQVLEVQHLDAPGGPHSDHRAVLARLKRE